jgi:DNA-binding response OmpR family regulator
VAAEPLDVAAEPVPVAILADDLIWATRLAASAEAAGLRPRGARRLADLEAILGDAVGLAIVDLTARAYDGVEAVRAAADAGARVLAVGQHDDRELRRRAIEAGAGDVLPYRRLFEDGPAVLRGWSLR